jgi:hypothetical protein
VLCSVIKVEDRARTGLTKAVLAQYCAGPLVSFQKKKYRAVLKKTKITTVNYWMGNLLVPPSTKLNVQISFFNFIAKTKKKAFE